VSKKNPKVKVALKYCGSCNPRVDLSRIARHLARVAEEQGDFQLVPLSENDVDVMVILCGCPRACGNKEEVRARAKRSLFTAGESVNRRAVPETQLPIAVEQELSKILDSQTIV
jgi:hypothetical protein